MTIFVVVLLLVGLSVWLSAARPSPTAPLQDRDRERQLDELRGLAGSRADVHV